MFLLAPLQYQKQGTQEGDSPTFLFLAQVEGTAKCKTAQ